MNDEEKRIIRENTNMKVFNFYLDDVTKLEVLTKMKELGLDGTKGTFSALIRVLLHIFAEGEHPNLDYLVKKNVEKEVILTTKKNKRSKM